MFERLRIGNINANYSHKLRVYYSNTSQHATRVEEFAQFVFIRIRTVGDRLACVFDINEYGRKIGTICEIHMCL
jgi:dUTPase